MADVLRIALGLAYLAASERKKGGQFAIVDSAGNSIASFCPTEVAARSLVNPTDGWLITVRNPKQI
jgi:hypothetical protein